MKLIYLFTVPIKMAQEKRSWKDLCDNDNNPEGFSKIHIDKHIGKSIFCIGRTTIGLYIYIYILYVCIYFIRLWHLCTV